MSELKTLYSYHPFGLHNDIDRVFVSAQSRV